MPKYCAHGPEFGTQGATRLAKVEVKALKKTLLLASMAALLIGAAAAQEEPVVATQSNVEPVSIPASKPSYSPNDMKIIGTLSSGQTSKLVQYSRTPQYRAFVFEGNGRDQVEVTVTGADRKAFIALADSTLAPIAHGTGRLSATLPYHGPDTEAFYILFKGSTNQPAQLSVHLKKTPATMKPTDATR
jgi:hypothetical protein